MKVSSKIERNYFRVDVNHVSHVSIRAFLFSESDLHHTVGRVI